MIPMNNISASTTIISRLFLICFDIKLRLLLLISIIIFAVNIIHINSNNMNSKRHILSLNGIKECLKTINSMKYSIQRDERINSSPVLDLYILRSLLLPGISNDKNKSKIPKIRIKCFKQILLIS